MNDFFFTKKQLALIIESDYNYHKGDLSDDLTELRPHLSDNIIRMLGRGTGHFGSGLYFSTYKCGQKEDFGDENLNDKKLTRINDLYVYRVDFDIYKNLYRVKSNKHGYLLFNVLKATNEIFYRFVDFHSGKFEFDDTLTKKYLILRSNLSTLNLRLPKYIGFISMLKKAGLDLISGDNIASFSTRIMEYNGYNGVNVSGIWDYDNTLHGSVIYDLSKLDGDIKEIEDPSFYCDMKNGVILDSRASEYKRTIDSFLSNKINIKINIFSIEEQKYIIRKYNRFIDPVVLDSLDDYVRKLYYKTLGSKIKRELIEDKPEKGVILDLIENAIDVVEDEGNKIDGETLLEIALDYYYYLNSRLPYDFIDKIRRPLNEKELEILNLYK